MCMLVVGDVGEGLGVFELDVETGDFALETVGKRRVLFEEHGSLDGFQNWY